MKTWEFESISRMIPPITDNNPEHKSKTEPGKYNMGMIYTYEDTQTWYTDSRVSITLPGCMNWLFWKIVVISLSMRISARIQKLC